MQNEMLDWLLAHYGQEIMRPGLDRIKEAITPLMPSFKDTRVIIIAGTNGKGETTLHLSHLLKDRSHFVWTSPHIERITERFRNEKGEIDISELKELIFKCHEKVVALNLKLSFYEFLFFVFCSWAAQANPEFLLLEVGLGGRLDAVNTFDAELVLLPSISRDHQEILGNRYEQILKEKLGTLRKTSTLISFLHSKYLRDKTQAYLSSVGAKGRDLSESLVVPDFEFSRRNYLLACAAYCHLLGREFQSEQWSQGSIKLSHRGEVLREENEWSFFGSHNVDGMRKLIQFLHSHNYTFSRPSFDSVIVAFSERSEKDLRVMLKMLKLAQLGRIIVTNFSHPKAARLDVVKALSEEEGLEFAQDISSIVQGWTNKRVLVTGSYYFIGSFKSFICRR